MGSRESNLKGELTYNVNKERNYINNRLYGSFTVDRSDGTSLLQQKLIQQSVALKKSYLTEDFEITHRLKNGNTIEGASLSTYSYLPGQLLRQRDLMSVWIYRHFSRIIMSHSITPSEALS